jgi:hypothetical protein
MTTTNTQLETPSAPAEAGATIKRLTETNDRDEHGKFVRCDVCGIFAAECLLHVRAGKEKRWEFLCRGDEACVMQIIEDSPDCALLGRVILLAVDQFDAREFSDCIRYVEKQ